MKEDTIAAIATPVGEGGIGIIRISGERSLEILGKVFRPVKKQRSEDTGCGNRYVPEALNSIYDIPVENRRMTYGFIEDGTGKKVDEVLCVYMKAPYTYTTEDVVEINCHGSVVALKKTLSLVLANGARIAEPGEFTKRAFLNGRLDLSQAEAVMDLIKAKTDKGFDAAMTQLSGGFSDRINAITSMLMDVLVNITVNIEYPEEDIEEVSYKDLIKSLSQINDKIDRLLDGADTGRIIREGLKVAIIGRPNVGKSSLMNALMKESRAIVTEIPGTTRDTIEEMISIKGIPVVLTDTAGIRETSDEIEKIGIEKSKLAANGADLIIFMTDGSEDITDEDIRISEVIENRNVIAVINKRDKGLKTGAEDIRKILPCAEIVETSIAKDEGLSIIEDKVEELVYGGNIKRGQSLLVTNVRHEDLLKKASGSVKDALMCAENKEPLDIVEIDVREAYDLLGEITGKTVNDDIINEVFSRFCLGK